SWLGAERDLKVPVAAALALTAVALVRRREIWIPLLWLVAAFLGMNTASLYWPHYYVQLLGPLALLLAVGAASLPGRLLAVSVVAVVTVPAALKLAALVGMSRGATE